MTDEQLRLVFTNGHAQPSRVSLGSRLGSRVPDLVLFPHAGQLDPGGAVPHFTYVVYDRAERVIYVGMSVTPWSRMSGHRKASRWFESAYRIDCYQHANRALAAQDENRLIQELKPRWNVIGMDAIQRAKP